MPTYSDIQGEMVRIDSIEELISAVKAEFASSVQSLMGRRK